MPAQNAEILFHGGRVFCAATGIDGVGGVLVRGDRIVASGADAAAAASASCEVRDFPNALLLPGLVDLHAHPAREGSKYGVDPDAEFLPRGVTTAMSQGDAGANNWDRFRETTAEACRTRVRMAINLAASGETSRVGCFEDLDDADVDACVRTIQSGGELIWGIAVNASRFCCGESNPREVLRRGLEAAERTERPLLYGMRQSDDWSFEEQMALLRPGDVVTYCFRPEPEGLVVGGRVPDVFRQARDRGIVFDLGHGWTSFDYPTAEAAIRDGFPPDTISTDSYAKHLGAEPPHSLARTMSKVLAAGMEERAVLTAVTDRPARALGLAGEIGTLAPGACADLTLLEWKDDVGPLVDTRENVRPGGGWEAVCTVRAGDVIR